MKLFGQLQPSAPPTALAVIAVIPTGQNEGKCESETNRVKHIARVLAFRARSSKTVLVATCPMLQHLKVFLVARTKPVLS